MKSWTRLAGAFAVLAFAGAAHAQNYPAHDVKMIVPFPAGGPSDTVARIVAEGMSRHLGQQVVVENVGGAGGTLGATRASEAQPDGYTHHGGEHGHSSLRRRPSIRTSNTTRRRILSRSA